jgi:hypothetical protein
MAWRSSNGNSGWARGDRMAFALFAPPFALSSFL